MYEHDEQQDGIQTHDGDKWLHSRSFDSLDVSADDAEDAVVWVPEVPEHIAWTFQSHEQLETENIEDPDWCFGSAYAQSAVESQANEQLNKMREIWTLNDRVSSKKRCIMIQRHYNRAVRPYTYDLTDKPWPIKNIYKYFAHDRLDTQTELDGDLRNLRAISDSIINNGVFLVNKSDPKKKRICEKHVTLYLKVYKERRMLSLQLAEGRSKELVS
jgi:hypothetical protein